MRKLILQVTTGRVLAPCLTPLLFMGFCHNVSAQEFRATVTGVVTDDSGALLVKADVLITNNATQQTYKATTTRRGTYYVPYVIPGNYTIQVSASGFKTEIQDQVTILASEYRGLNFKLHVGAASDSVTVTDAPPLINTADGSGGTIISQEELENVPINGRQVYTLLGTTPSTQSVTTNTANTSFNSWNTNDAYVVGGGMQGYQQFTLNGTNITAQSTGSAGSWEFAPNVDALQEVNVMTSTYDARFSRTGNGTVAMVVKNGTNHFHGNVYEYIENNIFNANNFTNNNAGIQRQGMHQNQFGGTIGGPVRKDKIFFFGSYEGYRQALADTTLTSVPAAYMHPTGSNGVNFTGSGYTIYDPNTTVCTVAGGTLGNCNGTYARTAFANDTLPAARINPIGAAIVNLYPMPNIQTTALQNNFIANTPAHLSYDQYMARVDYNTSPKARWYSLFATQGGTQYQNTSGFTGVAATGNINAKHRQVTAAQDLTYTITPRMLLDVKASLSRVVQFTPNGDFSLAQPPGTIGLSMPSIPTTSLQDLPEFTTSQFYPQVVGNVLTSGSYDDIALVGDLTREWGPHAFHFGGEYHHYDHGTPGQAGYANGSFQFGTGATQYNPLTRNTLKGINDGFDIADMLLGDPNPSPTSTTASGVQWNPQTYSYFAFWGLYAQDDWRIAKNLTLNLGIRYDVQMGEKARFNAINRGMCLTCVNPVSGMAGYQTNLAADGPALTAAGINVANLTSVTGGIEFAGANGQPSVAYDTQWNNVAPRVGFAWQIDPLTVIRGGYGIMYSFGLENGTYSGYNQTTYYDASNNGGVTPSGYFAAGNPFPNGAQQPAGAAGGLLTNIGNTQSLDFPQRKIPYSHMASLGFQHAFPRQITLDARYSGDFAYNLRVSTTLNAVSPQQLATAIANPNYFSQQVVNPYYGVLPATSTIGSSKTISALTLMQPYSEFGEVQWDAAPLGRNLYDALEVKLNKRMGGPEQLDFAAVYTWSKNMQGNSFTNSYPYQDPTVRYQIGPYDRTNIFAFTSQWKLPIGKGQYWLSTPNVVASQFISGWQFSSILTVASGFPVSIDNAYYYNCNHSFAPAGHPTLSNWLYNSYTSGSTLGCYATIPQYALKNMGARTSQIRNPIEPNLDATLQKSFAIREGVNLTFRADAFNLTNSVLFPGPDDNPNDGAPKAGANGAYTGYGTIALTQQNQPRIIQFALKLAF